MNNSRLPEPNFSHLIDLLNTRATDLGDTPLYRYLETGDIDSSTIVWSYADLDHRARAIAARLQELNAFGERVVLLYAPGLDFIAAFFGCLYAGAIAVPAYPPDPTRLLRTLPRLRAIGGDARARFVLTTSDIMGFAEVIGPQAPELAAMHWMATDDMNIRDGAFWSRPNIDADSIAFLQYTSGSTGDPKGVMVRHRNLFHNSEVIAAGFEHDEHSIGVGWLPMFHDMGLIGNVLQPLFVGFPCVLMSPLAFLQRPARWLEAISHFRATTSGGPNFAYDLCARRATLAQIESLDLSSWNVAFSGAEPIRKETLVRFADIFAPAGFRAQAYYCCYGLAEATLLVTGASKSEPPCTITVDAEALEGGFAETNTADHKVRPLVSSGKPGAGMRVEIVDPTTLRPCASGSIGEIWVAGASVAAGYWNQSAENEITFHAHLADTGDGPFLRTGDLGFVREGQLFVTGRRKDLLIIAGRNHYPHDIERAVETAHRLVRAGCCAAFPLEVATEERLGIAVEVQAVEGPEIDTVVAAIRHAVLEEFGVYAHAVVLLAPRSIPKTSSGKIQRSACREAFLSGTLDEAKRSIAEIEVAPFAGASEETPTELKNVLANVFADVLGISHVGMHDSLFSLGLQSLLATQAVSRLRDALGVDITLRMLFDAPSVADLARAIEPLMHPGSRVLLPTIPLVLRTRPLPLSFSQERLWFLDQFDPNSSLYNISAALRLFGPLDVTALERSFQEMLTRHEALRTTFSNRDGQAHQVIAPIGTFDLPVIQVEASQIQARIAEEVRRPFDLTQGPLMRAMLFGVPECERVLLLVIHHIVSDGWSMNVFVREISALYGAFCHGNPSPLPALPMQYADYAAWQRQDLSGETLERQLEYWKGRLAGAPAAIELPTDKPRPPVQSHKGASIPLALSRDLSGAMGRLGQSEGATLFMTLLGAFAVLLSRYTGQDELVIGSPIANRTRPEVEGLIGLFVNTLALRIRLSRQSTFRTLLAQIREETLGAYAHQDTPFEKLVDELAPVRDPSRSPIFQVMFVLQDDPAEKISLPGLDVRRERVDSGTAKFDLTMLLHETSDGLRGTIDYSTDIFEAVTIARLAGHFEVLLRGIVDGPDSSIALLPLLTEPERRQVLVEWNDTRVEVPADKCIHDLFADQVAKTPDAIAASFEEQQLTYAELNTRANQLAHYLRTLRVGPEVLVGLCVERSIEMVVGLLAILKAGGAYVPIDPTYPKERIARTIADAGVGVILTQSRIQSTLPLHGARVVRLDMDTAQWSDGPTSSPKSETHPDNAAYVIYTSGSTGKPKGVLVSHAGLPNLAHSRKRRHHLRSGEKALVFASFAFDSFVADLWGALASGACAVIPTERERTDMALLEQLLTQVNAAVLPPAILPGLSPLALSTNLMLGVAGDVCPAHEVRRWSAGRKLSNLYGPTEVTVETIVYDTPEDSREAMPIGRPVENTNVFVVDDIGMLVPIGIPGELCISGVGLARGYSNQPAMTAERFVPNPFGPPGSRMYRTGDLARWRADGNLEFIGRIDNQVKIRGYRIELGEIESVLSQHPAIRGVVVIAREDVPGDKRLVAYVVLTDEETSTNDLREYLRAKLPDYMVPAAFVVLDALPLTPNGKVNRKMLPAPKHDSTMPDLIVARNANEELLTAIWAEVLHVDKIGIDDNFFDLGGHSLLATQVVSRIGAAFGIDLPLRTLFEAPTVALLAPRLERIRREEHALVLPPLRRAPRDTHLPLSFAQQRLWFLDQFQPNNPFYNTSTVVRLRGPLDVRALERSFQEIVKRHEALRTTFAVVDGTPHQVIADDFILPLWIHDVDVMEIQEHVAAEAQKPFDLVCGPLVRTTILRVAEDDHTLLLTMHHVVSDGWSMGVFVREVAVLYDAYAEGRPSPLAALSIQYADYASWQREWLIGDILEGQIAYWRQRLSDASFVLELPTDKPRPAIQSHRGARVPVTIERALTEAITRLGRHEGATLFMTLLAAFAILLHRHSGSDDIVIGSPIAHRTRPEFEDLIGFFVNTLAIRTRPSGDSTFREFLGLVREEALGAYMHQDVPFEKLVEVLSPTRDMSRTPIFQAMFVLQNMPMGKFEQSGLELEFVSMQSVTAKFDLWLSLTETPTGLDGVLEFSTDLFEVHTMLRMVEHFNVLLHAIVQSPDARISSLTLLSVAERRRLLVEWNDTKVEYPTDELIHEFFMDQAAKTPEAEALIFENDALTYRELDAKSNQVAHRLQRFGVGPDVLVAICVERSLEMVIGLLGILKAGGAYVPLDPEYPDARLAFMLEDARPRVILSQMDLADLLSPGEATILCLDAKPWSFHEESTSPPARGTLSPHHLAYAIHTSGSTGKPKGAMNEHAGILNRLLWMQRAFHLTPSDTVLQKTPFSFDVSVWEFFWPLMFGARLLIARPGGHRDPTYLVDLIRQHGVTLLHFVPSMLQVFLDNPQVASCTSLRYVLASGEALTPALCNRFFQLFHRAELHNLYGPTEAAVDVTHWKCHPDAWKVPIGKPIDNVRIYILDGHLEPVPIGVVGELYIGGVQVGRGYLNRPELTRERFIQDPFSSDPDARLYKTGDSCRRLADGAIEYLGRIDQQIKIRGFRIETVEIESVLCEQPELRDVVVVAREDIPGDKRLVAYVVPKSEAMAASGGDETADRIAQWTALYDDTYRADANHEGTFNIVGWNSSYTGKPIAAEEMRHWVNTTVDRILALGADRIMEIGTGTGLLRFRIAPHALHYYGTDISATALHFQRQVADDDDRVVLAERPAHDFEGIEPRSFDAVVVNSVIQYFPNVDYLVQVLDGAVRAVVDGGHIFLGDVRSLPLLAVLHTDIELYRAENNLSIDELRRRIARRRADEEELLLHPEFFPALQRHNPRIRRVRLRSKRGAYHNELSRFRYDIVLDVGPNCSEGLAGRELDWTQDELTLPKLRELLGNKEKGRVCIRHVPDRRIAREVAAVSVIAAESSATKVRDVRAKLASMTVGGIEPEDVWRLGDELGVALDLQWSGDDAKACFDIVVHSPVTTDVTSVRTDEPAPSPHFHDYANNPLRKTMEQMLIPRLRKHLEAKLPDYMVPSAFVVLEHLPLTVNGKVNRRALPAPQARAGVVSAFTAPRNGVEHALAAIWAGVLYLEHVGIDDNFFDLGGHSLLATQVVSRIRAAFNVELPVRVLFDAPTIAELAEKIGLSQSVEISANLPPLVPVPRTGALPLSFAQERLWFLDQLEPNNPFYNSFGAVRLRGDLDVHALERSLQEIVHRHEALRTTFTTKLGQAYQVITTPAPYSLHVVPTDASDVAARIAREAATPFDLARGPLLRTTLLRISDREHVLLLTMHHIISDGWSLDVFVREITLLYQAFRAGESPPLPALAIQYVDYAAWQRKWLSGEVLAKQIAYWRRRLAGAPAAIDLPTDKPRPAMQSHRGSSLPIVLPQELSVALIRLSRSEGATLFMTLLSAFAILLHRYSGQDELVIGSPIANRTRAELEGLIGFFVNTLALRMDLSEQPTFRALLARVREELLGAYAHQDVPFEKLVEELAPERDMSRSPIFQVMFVLQNTPTSSITVSELEVSSEPTATTTAKFDLMLSLHETAEGLRGAIEYATDIFEPQTIERLVGHYEVLLQGIVDEPDAVMTKLPLLTESERHELLIECNDTAVEYPENQCIHELFTEQAAQTPDSIAVVFEDQQLTYAQLDARANQLAQHLRTLGVGPDVPVGICVERSLEMVVGILGILRAGGAYVPMDSTYPKERITFMLEDTRARVVLTQTRFVDKLPADNVCIVCLDDDAFQRDDAKSTPASSRVLPQNVAYVMYTSGSTGFPKGVMVSHGALVNHMAWFEREMQLTQHDRVIQKTPFAFDASVWEFFAPLLVGARLVMAPVDIHQDPAALGQCMRETAITVLQAVPTLLTAMVDARAFDRQPALRLVCAGGEQLPRRLFESIQSAAGCEVCNLYGPTEVTIDATTGSCRDGMGNAMPIGVPRGNVQAYIVTPDLELVPKGIAGELFLSGVQLARGYVNRPALTAERFIPHPFPSEPGARVYRTGDLCRRRADGNLEFLGRIDHQIKLRGYRIEPGEIVHVLERHPAVRDAVVIAREDIASDKRLVAYLVVHDASVSTNDLRRYLEATLPVHAVPSAFVVLDALPLTANGKVDRKALPVPDVSNVDVSHFVAPRNITEELLAGIWTDVLHVEKIGSFDHFFELGGHSLLATQVVSRIRTVFGIDFPLRGLFEAPTLNSLAKRVDEARDVTSSFAIPPLGPVPRTEPLPLSFAQQRLWFLDQFEPESAFYNIPGAVRLRGPLEVSTLERCLQEMVHRHEALRTTFATIDGRPHQVISSPSTYSLHLVNVEASEVRARAAQEAATPFDLARGPLMRATLLRLSENEHVLLLTMHHIVSDGWSMGVFVREITVLYQALHAGKPSPLPALPIQYADYAVWQRQWLSGETLERQIRYWKQRLAGAPSAIELPTDKPRPPVQSYRGDWTPLVIPKELTASLQTLARREGATLFMLLLGAFAVLLHRYSGQDDIVIGSPIANRTRAEVEGLVGFFVNTLALRTDLSGQPTFRALLARVREALLGAYAHQDVPFEKLVEELAPERDMSRSPIFQVMFVLQNTPASSVTLSDLELSPEPQETTTATFDLTLSLTETSEGLRGVIEYCTDLFEPRTIERLSGHFVVLLRSIVENPDTAISHLPLLTPTERHQLLVEWNDTVVDYPAAASIHALFEEQVARAPHAIAVVYENEEITYAELNARANQLARQLRPLTREPEALIGLCVERSLEMIVGVLGILKAGAAYVPLDPEYPEERLHYMMHDAKLGAVVTKSTWLKRLESLEIPQVLFDDAPNSAINDGFDPLEIAAPNQLAYVVYTSGSTGRPKGVGVSHAALLSTFFAWRHSYELAPGMAHLQMANFSFDVFAGDWIRALCSGGTLVVCPRETMLAPDRLYALMRARKIDIAEFVPAVLRQLVAYAAEANLQLDFMKWLIAGSDLWTERDLDEVRAVLTPATHIVNSYGVAEGTIDSTFYEARLASAKREGSVPIGRPFHRVQIYVLDHALEPVPVGIAGELYIGGAALARGYRGKPGLTATRFVPNPFDSASGARLYRTGDLVRWNKDGLVEFLGRVDLQVKIRGLRIELGEIEDLLGKHPHVRSGIVVAREDVPGDKRLVAYVVLADENTSTNNLREYLRAKLPDYMVPTAFLILDALPLTPNGKVDRNGLPVPDAAAIHGETFVSPRSITGQLLADIWADVLHLERVGEFDNFFELGGHSLLATLVVSRIRATLGADLPLRALFEAPTVASLAQRIERAREAGTAITLPPLVPVPREGALPLSFAQQRLWFLDQLEPNNPFYNISGAVRLRGRLDVSALERSLEEIVRRHEALRTTFPTIDGLGYQVIMPPAAESLNVVDVETSDVRARVDREIATPFDLARGPLMRSTLLRLSEREHVLLLTMHHIVSDGWSIDVFIREITALYQAFQAGEPSPLPEPTIQYADYAAWQRQWLSGETLTNQIKYWKQRLAGAPSVLELPTDKPRPPVMSHRGAWIPVAISRELSEALVRLSRCEGVTLFMTLLGAFAVLLHRYTGVDELVIGTPIANRTRPEIEGLIGFFVNTLAIRTDVSGQPTFRALLARVREELLGAYAHQDVPFEKLVEELAPGRDMSRSPIFQVMFVLQNTPASNITLADLELSAEEAENITAKFDLSLSLEETAEGLRGVFEYCTDIFESRTIERLAGHFEVLLRGIVDHCDSSVARLPLLTESERHQVLVEWNDTQVDFPADKCIHDLFAEQAAKTPDAIAVSFEEQQLTYGELDTRSNQLAHYLQQLGVGPDALVGICLERSIEMVIGILGILKAGGAYVPMDPTYPKERIAFMLDDARLGILVTQTRLEAALSGHSGHFVFLDAQPYPYADQPQTMPHARVMAENTAYVIYTSGSTGKPKGVEVPHRAPASLWRHVRAHFDISADARVLQVGSLSFDVSVLEFGMAFLFGATLVLAPAHATYDLQTLLQIRAITVACLTPAVLEVLRPEETSLRWVTSGADKCTASIAQTWSRRTAFFNMYGPTEATVYCLSRKCSPEDDLDPAIGTPNTNMRAYVLDRALEPAAVGLSGELYLAGAQVTRGYLRRPGLTAETFIPDPFGPPGSRMYRTGDLARWRADGNLEFLGRIDHQVKIRGFRIELGEIESVLSQHPEVRDAVVLAREDIPNEKRLVAYVVPADSNVSTNDLRGHLRSKLPEYMVPAAFVFLDAWPVTPHGKVDRRALPAPDKRSETSLAVDVPRTPTEAEMVALWSEVLHLDHLGIHDDFFALGGHSLLAVQLVARVRNHFGVALPLRELFQKNTVAAMSQVIDQLRNGETPPDTESVLERMHRDARLDAGISPPEPYVASERIPRAILLTGATGFVGAFLLRELLDRTSADMHCLVRAANDDEARERLLRGLKSYGLWDDRFSGRIIAVRGNLELPRLGLSATDFAELARRVDVIYHNGADVNFVHGYDKLRAANVLGTIEVLRLASLEKTKVVHYVSTLSVFTSDPGLSQRTIDEETEPDRADLLDGGYEQSKWVAERLVLAARERGVPTIMYRPGLVSGHSMTGVSPTGDFFMRIIKGCMELGLAPDIDVPFDLVPVDYVVEALVQLSLQTSSLGKTFHLLGSRPVFSMAIVESARRCGYAVKLVDSEVWRQAVLTAPFDNALAPLRELFERPIKNDKDQPPRRMRIDDTNTRMGIVGSGIECPEVNDEVLDRYIAALIRCGFLEKP